MSDLTTPGDQSPGRRSVRRPALTATNASRGKAPKRIERIRTCANCGARLNSYNPNPTCYLHTPTRFPRMRAS